MNVGIILDVRVHSTIKRTKINIEKHQEMPEEQKWHMNCKILGFLVIKRMHLL